jgi:hypothetical protein
MLKYRIENLWVYVALQKFSQWFVETCVIFFFYLLAFFIYFFLFLSFFCSVIIWCNHVMVWFANILDKLTVSFPQDWQPRTHILSAEPRNCQKHLREHQNVLLPHDALGLQSAVSPWRWRLFKNISKPSYRDMVWSHRNENMKFRCSYDTDFMFRSWEKRQCINKIF